MAKLQQLLNDSDSSDTDSSVDSCDETSPDEAQSAGDPSDNELSHVLDTFSPFLHSPFPEPSASVVQEQDGSGDNTQNASNTFRTSFGRVWNKNLRLTSTLL